MSELQLWGGVECTVVRIETEQRDQLLETGHHGREDDLDLIAALGIRTIRYPVLWERVAPVDLVECDWAWSDARLERLQMLGVTPILGLVHHGAGPSYTNLLDPLFAEKLATYARGVATRYPWVCDWTPVNEPLTTARFSGLYGLWHPHGRDERTFLTALINQCRGVMLAMQAIREIRPSARLVQTEDLGRVFSTPAMAQQAEYENDRRWLSLDLLCGRVDRHHNWYARLITAGIAVDTLDAFVKSPCSPNIVGINHYVTSDRFLDERVTLYPDRYGGVSDGIAYADIEAVRIRLPEGSGGFEGRLREAWDRYRLPMAVTEAHLGCAESEESRRWLVEIWKVAKQLRKEGMDLRAVTVWSMFGAMDWQSLLCRRDGAYEPGVFDVRHDPPRPTPLAEVILSLATTGNYDPPPGDGWWRRPDRFLRAADDTCFTA